MNLPILFEMANRLLSMPCSSPAMKEFLSLITISLISLSHADESVKDGEPVKTDEIAVGEITKPIEIEKSPLLGMTEAEVLKKLEIKELKPEPKQENKKSYAGAYVEPPFPGGYAYRRDHVLTFDEGRVVKHEVVDKVAACVIMEMIEP